MQVDKVDNEEHTYNGEQLFEMTYKPEVKHIYAEHKAYIGL